MIYAKLIEGELVFAPNPIKVGEAYIGNPLGSVYEAEGYKPVSFINQPEPLGTGWWIETWTEAENMIVQGWTWHEATDEDEISSEEALQILLGGNIE